MRRTPRSADAAARILAMVESVPKGSVATYGQIAAEAGLPRRARLVGRVLSELPAKSKLPWHRVVNAAGAISIRGGEREASPLQMRRLRAEGIKFRDSGRIDLKQYGWSPNW